MAGPFKSIICERCGREKDYTNFFKAPNVLPDGERIPICKNCLTKGIDNRDPETFKPLLKIFDVPYIEKKWIQIANKQFLKNPKKFGPSSVLGMYIRAMQMAQYKKYRYADSDMLNAPVKPYNAVRQTEVLDKLVAQGDMTEEERAKLVADAPEEDDGGIRIYTEEDLPAFGININAYAADIPPEMEQTPHEVADNFQKVLPAKVVPKKMDFDEKAVKKQQLEAERIAQEEKAQEEKAKKLEMLAPSINEETIREQLTQDDIQYLAVKWGISYTPSEWVRLEDLYQQYAKQYDLNVDREESIRKICRTSIKMDQALDIDDTQSYKNLSSVYDQLRKSARLTEAQNKEEQARDIDSIGQLVSFVEHESGVIPQQFDPIEYPQDKVDFVINDLQNYVSNLIRSELGLGDLIESYIEKADKQQTETVESIMQKAFKEPTEEDLKPPLTEEEKEIQEYEEYQQEAFRLMEQFGLL